MHLLLLSERGFSPESPRKNAYKKDDYEVKCPDLIEPLFLHSHLLPSEYCLLGNFVVNGVLRTGTNQNGIAQRHFTEYANLATIFTVKVNNY